MPNSIVLMSDIHGNLPALQAVADSLPPSKTVVVAGDHCVDGPCPAEVLDLLGELEWTLITGNTDRNVIEDHGGTSAAWCREKLGKKRIEFLSQLDFSVSLDGGRERGSATEGRATAALQGRREQGSALGTGSDGVAQDEGPNEAILVVHANPLNLEDPLHPTMSEQELQPYLENMEEGILAFGHLHTPYVRPVSGKLLIDVSSVGHPKDRDPRASFTVVNLENGVRSVEQIRVPYDVEQTLHLMEHSGMPAAEKHMKALLKASY